MKISSSYTALLMPLLIVFLTTAALPFPAFGAGIPATDSGRCEVGPKEINPAVLMHMKDMGDRVLRALYDKANGAPDGNVGAQGRQRRSQKNHERHRAAFLAPGNRL